MSRHQCKKCGWGLTTTGECRTCETSPKRKKYTSDFLSQFNTVVGCTFSQDIVDGLRKEIVDLKEEVGRLGAECQEAERQRLMTAQEVDALKAENASLKKENADLQECLADLRDDISDC